jgi:hypothetical protein
MPTCEPACGHSCFKDALARLTLRARGRDLHWIKLEAVEAGFYRRIILPELLDFGYIVDFEDGHSECAGGREDRAVEENFAGVEMLPEIYGVLTHQRAFFGSDIAGKS